MFIDITVSTHHGLFSIARVLRAHNVRPIETTPVSGVLHQWNIRALDKSEGTLQEKHANFPATLELIGEKLGFRDAEWVAHNLPHPEDIEGGGPLGILTHGQGERLQRMPCMAA